MQRAKLTVMLCAALFMVSAIPAALSSSVVGLMVLISFATFGHGCWFSNVLTMPSDIAPRKLVASVYGISGMGGGLGGILFTELTGFVVDRFHTFTPVFVIAGLSPLVATGVLWLLGGHMNKLPAVLPKIAPEIVPRPPGS